jgi:hypothetical protein
MLPAPRDPQRPEAASPDPPPLETLLRGLLQGAGAQAARAVDGSSGAALAEVGLADGDDVAALMELTRAASAAGRSRGEWLEDVVVTLGRTVHVLRECGAAVLHARLDPARGDVDAVRRALAGAEMQRAVVVTLRSDSEGSAEGSAVDSAVDSAAAPDVPALVDVPTLPSMRPVSPPPRPVPAPARPLARLPEPAPPPPPSLPPFPLPRAGAGAGGQEPALVTVDGGAALTRTGALAVLALPPVASLPRRRPTVIAPPARPQPAASGPAVLRRPWASDLGTMHRVLTCLQRMG